MKNLITYETELSLKNLCALSRDLNLAPSQQILSQSPLKECLAFTWKKIQNTQILTNRRSKLYIVYMHNVNRTGYYCQQLLTRETEYLTS